MPPITLGQVVAFGGGGFAMEPDNPLLDDYVLSLTGKRRPRVCLIPTASGDAAGWIEGFHRIFAHRAETSHLALFNRSVADLHAFLLAQDVLYVGGGNTVNLLAVWRAHGLDRVLPEVLARGVIACGVSAGGLCWFQRGVTDSYGPELQPLAEGLGFIEGAFCPHYDSDAGRPGAFQELVRRTGVAGYGADDGVGLHYADGALRRVVSSRPGALAWRVQPHEGGVRSAPVAPEYLGGMS